MSQQLILQPPAKQGNNHSSISHQRPSSPPQQSCSRLSASSHQPLLTTHHSSPIGSSLSSTAVVGGVMPSSDAIFSCALPSASDNVQASMSFRSSLPAVMAEPAKRLTTATSEVTPMTLEPCHPVSCSVTVAPISTFPPCSGFSVGCGERSESQVHSQRHPPVKAEIPAITSRRTHSMIGFVISAYNILTDSLRLIITLLGISDFKIRLLTFFFVYCEVCLFHSNISYKYS